MECLGKDIEHKFVEMDMSLPLKTILMIGIQMTERIEYIHNKNIIFRDVKPDNFLLGSTPNTENILHLIDFGLAKYFVGDDGQHIPKKDKTMITGTARYMSINVHHGVQASRRDDVESIAYVLYYFLFKGTLPWQGLQGGNNIEKMISIGEMKQKTSPEHLSSLAAHENPGMGHLKQFSDYLKHARNLPFTQKPDYKFLIQLLRQCMKEHNIKDDGHFDWTHHGGKGGPVVLHSKVIGPTATNRPVHGSAVHGHPNN